MKKSCLLCLVLVLAGCVNRPFRRTLTEKEMTHHRLNGIIHGAKICPNKFNETSQSLNVTGPCEIVDCEPVNEKIVCSAVSEKLLGR